MSNHSEYRPIVYLKARAWQDGQSRDIEAKGQVARSLAALAETRQTGVTSLEISSWALRLSAYIHELRHDYELDIETQTEKHTGGWHARYVLHTPVEILEVVFG